MIALETHAEGVVLPVRAQPGARRNEIRDAREGALRLGVTASPERGRANRAILDLLSKHLGLRKSQLEILAGETSRQKRLLVRDIAPEELLARIKRALGKGGE